MNKQTELVIDVANLLAAHSNMEWYWDHGSSKEIKTVEDDYKEIYDAFIAKYDKGLDTDKMV